MGQVARAIMSFVLSNEPWSKGTHDMSSEWPQSPLGFAVLFRHLGFILNDMGCGRRGGTGRFWTKSIACCFSICGGCCRCHRALYNLPHVFSQLLPSIPRKLPFVLWGPSVRGHAHSTQVRPSLILGRQLLKTSFALRQDNCLMQFMLHRPQGSRRSSVHLRSHLSPALAWFWHIPSLESIPTINHLYPNPFSSSASTELDLSGILTLLLHDLCYSCNFTLISVILCFSG